MEERFVVRFTYRGKEYTRTATGSEYTENYLELLRNKIGIGNIRCEKLIQTTN